MLHSNATVGNIHPAHNWAVADATARSALVPVLADVGKLCWQQNDGSLWILSDDSPVTWMQVGGVATTPYELPTASPTVLGGVKVGDRLSIAAGVLSADIQGGGNGDVSPVDYNKLLVTGTTSSIHTITIDKALVRDVAGNSILLTSVSEIVDSTISGLGGLDTGTVGVGWYHLWVIYNNTTLDVSAIFSLSDTAPTMPSGYTYKLYIGAFYSFGAGSGYKYVQMDNEVYRETTLASYGPGNVTTTPLSLIGSLPTNARKVKLKLAATALNSPNIILTTMSSYSDDFGAIHCFWPSDAYAARYYFDLPILIPQTVYFARSVGSDTLSATTVSAMGWKY